MKMVLRWFKFLERDMFVVVQVSVLKSNLHVTLKKRTKLMIVIQFH